MKENIVNTSASLKETRSVFVGAKVTPSQRDHIKLLAEQCGMTVSDYILSCAYNFNPFMVGWLGELSNVAEGVCQFLEAVKEKNRIPSNPQSEEK